MACNQAHRVVTNTIYLAREVVTDPNPFADVILTMRLPVYKYEQLYNPGTSHQGRIKSYIPSLSALETCLVIIVNLGIQLLTNPDSFFVCEDRRIQLAYRLFMG